MSFAQCPHCKKRVKTVNGDEGFICCTLCGRVIDSDMFSTEVTFMKNAGGQSQMSGSFVRSVESGFSESRFRSLEKGKEEISYLVQALTISGGTSTVNQAMGYYKIAFSRNFTRGRSTALVAAACLYITCREGEKGYLLIDFSEELRVNVYVLGAVFLQLCNLLRLGEEPFIQKLVDPSLFLHRFTERLLGAKNSEVNGTALRILASMKRDWMQTGRKPSGLCGAALYISASSYGVKCSKSEIASVVHICEATLTKRLIEFENTESGSLTIDEFNDTVDKLESESSSTELANMGIKSSGITGLLCQHKGSDSPHFAHGLCRSCYNEFVEISGGLQGGSDPPAFERAERERKEKSSAAEKAKEADTMENEEGPFSQPNQDVNVTKKLDSQLSEGGVCTSQAVNEVVGFQSHANEDINSIAGDEAESLSDIDDIEVSGYLHNEDEKRLKTIIWEELNKEYLEEVAAKEKAAKQAYEAKFQNCSAENLAAYELAAATAEAVAKSRKEKRQKKASEAKNEAPARTAAEAACQMLTRKKLNSKINYDVLKTLFEDSVDPKETKKRHIASDSNNDANGQEHIKWKKGFESDYVDNSNDVGQEDDYREDDMSRGMYGDDLYPGNEEQEEYSYDGFDY